MDEKMTPIFAAEDIVALVTAFPPPLPTRDHPSLVRSASGNRLLNSNHVLNQFRQLLETDTNRVRRSDLPARLNVQNIIWLLETYDAPVRHSKDKSFIIPDPEYERISAQFKSRVGTVFVSVQDFLNEADVSPECLDELLEGLCQVSENETAYVCASTLLAETKETINTAITGAGAEKIDLSALLPEVPAHVVLALAKEMTATDAGEVYLEQGSQSAVFVPALYTATKEKEKAAALESRVRDQLSWLEKDGLLEIPNVPNGYGVEVEEVMARYKAVHPGTTEFNTYEHDASSVALVSTIALGEIVEELKSYVYEFVDGHQRPNRILNSDLDAYLIDKTEKKALAELLLRCKDRRPIDATLEEALDQRDKRQFEDFARATILAPAQLYTIGADSIEDPALKKRCEEHICDYLRREILPLLGKGPHDQRDKSRDKDLDKLLQSSASVKTLADLNASLAKFSKKQKLSLPTPSQLATVKQDVLIRKVGDIGRMQRASDILQNVIWLLLAQRHGGLFMSSGKDTGRMIKQYQILGDEGIGKELEHWRDTLKKSEASENVVSEMRALAAKVVGVVVASVNTR